MASMIEIRNTIEREARHPGTALADLAFQLRFDESPGDFAHWVQANSSHELPPVDERGLPAPGTVPDAFRAHMEYALSWLADRRTQFAERVCINRSVQSYLSRGATEDVVMLCAAVADCIAAVCVNVAPATVAVLLVKLGLKSLCQGWTNAQDKPR